MFRVEIFVGILHGNFPLVPKCTNNLAGGALSYNIWKEENWLQDVLYWYNINMRFRPGIWEKENLTCLSADWVWWIAWACDLCWLIQILRLLPLVKWIHVFLTRFTVCWSRVTSSWLELLSFIDLQSFNIF